MVEKRKQKEKTAFVCSVKENLYLYCANSWKQVEGNNFVLSFCRLQELPNYLGYVPLWSWLELLCFPNQINHFKSKAHGIMPPCRYISCLFKVKKLWRTCNKRHDRRKMTLNSLDIGVTIKVIYLDLNSIRNIES